MDNSIAKLNPITKGHFWNGVKKANFSPFFIILVILMVFNIFVLKWAILGLILGVFWLFGPMSGVLGAKLAPNQPDLYKKAIGLMASLGLIIIISALHFYFFSFDGLAIVRTLILVSGVILYLMLLSKVGVKWQGQIFKVGKRNWADYILYLILFLLAWVLLLTNGSSEAIRSPWEVVPMIFFVVYFLMTGILIKILFSQDRDDQGLIVCWLHFFMSLMAGVMVYKIGFGFDPFVHRAAEMKLMELGYILPKPLYYLGQYSLVVFLSKIFFVSIEWIDKLLVPVLATLTLPTIAYYSLKDLMSNRKMWLVAVCSLLIIVTPLFFYTVPQSLGNLLLLVLIFILFNSSVKWWHWLMVGVIFVIHPLAGIPALILVGFKSFKSKLFRFIWYVLASALIPLFFMAGSLISDFDVKFSFNNLSNLGGLFENLFSYLPFYSVYHLVYLIGYNWLILFILVLVAGGYYLIKNRQKVLVINSLKLLIVLLINFFILGFFEFKAVIDYEQAEFAKRLGQIIILFLSPIFLMGVYYILSRIKELKAGKWMVIIVMAGILTISLYLSYPHVDAFEKNRGYSVSQSDIKAVHVINLDGYGKDFVVLANQSTSAASLQEFGFKEYYMDLFYYPLPTSSPLYEIYLKMVYDQPRLEYIEQVRELTGVHRVYFVINDYWLDAKKRIEQAREIADMEMSFDDRVWVFRFE